MACIPFAGGIVCTTRARRRRCQAPGCSSWASRQCDFPLEDGKTCDRHICEAHARAQSGSGADRIDYCPAHPLERRERFEVRAVDDEARVFRYRASFRLFHDACIAADSARASGQEFIVWDSQEKRRVYDSRLLASAEGGGM